MKLLRSLRPKNALSIVAIVAIGVIAVSHLLSVNAFPVIGNDAVVYLTHSHDLAGGGWVQEGFRQIGYPLALALVRAMAKPLGAESLLAMVVVQRILLIAACGFAIWRLRWWSLPLVAFLLIPSNIAYTDLLLTEGLGLPLGVLTVLAAVACLEAIPRDRSDQNNAKVGALMALAVLGALALLGIRFTYAVWAVVPLVLLRASWKTPYRRMAGAMFAVFMVLAGSFALVLAWENSEEMGVASPSSGGLPGYYYYAWMQVFEVHPDNRDDPKLTTFYDDGVVHDFSRQVTASGIPYADQDEVYATEIKAMLAAAGVSYRGSQVEAMLWSLAGGRLHDVEDTIRRVLAATRHDVEEVIYINRFANENGIRPFADTYNDGVLVEAVITDPIGARLPLPDEQAVLRVLLPLALVVLALAAIPVATRPSALIGLGVVLGTAVGVGVVRADNYRFLVASSAAGLAVASAVGPNVWKWVASRWSRSSRSEVEHV